MNLSELATSQSVQPLGSASLQSGKGNKKSKHMRSQSLTFTSGDDLFCGKISPLEVIQNYLL